MSLLGSRLGASGLISRINRPRSAEPAMPLDPLDSLLADDSINGNVAVGATEPESRVPQLYRRPEDLLGIIDSLRELIDAEQQRDAVGPAEIPEHPAIWPLPAHSEPAVQTEPCVVCGSMTAVPVFLVQGMPERLVQCADCGLGSLHPRPSAARVSSFYPAEYYGTPDAKFEPLVEAGVRFGAKYRASTLLKGLKPGSRVLDVGCGRGVMLRGILDLGHHAHGVEISAAAAEGVDPRAQVRIAPRLEDARYEDSSFDAVILWHVLEHLPRPDETLQEISRILKPGGRLVIAVPNSRSFQASWAGAGWFHLDLPRHLFHFSDRTLSRLVNRQGFRVTSLQHFALLQNSFGWLQSCLNRLSDAPRNSLYTLLHRYGSTSAPKLSRFQSTLLRAAYWIGLPIAVLTSLVEAACGRGGTVALTAELPAKIHTGNPAEVDSLRGINPSLAPCF